MKVLIKLDDIIYVQQCLIEIRSALNAGQVDQAKAYVNSLIADVGDGLKQI